MRKLALVAVSLIAIVVAAGCADGGYGAGYEGGSYYRPYDDVYYDGYYGPYAGGYWDGEAFWYSDGRGRHLRDEGHHFRHHDFPHSQHFHMGGDRDHGH